MNKGANEAEFKSRRVDLKALSNFNETFLELRLNNVSHFRVYDISHLNLSIPASFHDPSGALSEDLVQLFLESAHAALSAVAPDQPIHCRVCQRQLLFLDAAADQRVWKQMAPSNLNLSNDTLNPLPLL